MSIVISLFVGFVSEIGELVTAAIGFVGDWGWKDSWTNEIIEDRLVLFEDDGISVWCCEWEAFVLNGGACWFGIMFLDEFFIIMAGSWIVPYKISYVCSLDE